MIVGVDTKTSSCTRKLRYQKRFSSIWSAATALKIIEALLNDPTTNAVCHSGAQVAWGEIPIVASVVHFMAWCREGGHLNSIHASDVVSHNSGTIL
jgi:hypothetical protein